MATAEAAKTTALTTKGNMAAREQDYSDHFMQSVIAEFSRVSPAIAFTPYQKKLAQHLMIKIDASLKDLEVKRSNTPAKKDNKPITWENVNMEKLAVDAVDRIDLGLDALIPNHVHVIPYFNGRKQKYDLDLRPGYAGKDFYYQNMAIETPVNIIYELVCETDEFIPIKKSAANNIENYTFTIKNPFKRGNVIGGFGYVIYKEPTKNKLILVSDDDFKKSEAQGNKEFWSKHPDKMKLKTVVTRTVTTLRLDPEKINKAFLNVEAQEDAMDAAIVGAEIDGNANKGPVIDITSRQAATQTEDPPVSGNEPTEQDAGDPPVDRVASFKARLAAGSDFPELNAIVKEAKASPDLSAEEKSSVVEEYQAAAKRLRHAMQEQAEHRQEAAAGSAGPGF